MYFRVKDFPKFVNEEGVLFEWWDYKLEFTTLGFKTYKFTNDWNGGHWLDDHEYTWFVLRYS
jgi:hypothetical protein